MPSRTDNTTKWKELSEIDYFGLFVKNWLAFNSWYRGHHPQLGPDRQCIEAIKDASDTRNSTFVAFQRFMTMSDRASLAFRDDLDGLITALNRVTLVSSQYVGVISFENALIDSSGGVYKNLVRRISQRNVIKLGAVAVENDIEAVYKGAIELIYQIRCLLFHGELEPTDENHEIVKHAYLIINALMKDL